MLADYIISRTSIATGDEEYLRDFSGFSKEKWTVFRDKARLFSEGRVMLVFSMLKEKHRRTHSVRMARVRETTFC